MMGFFISAQKAVCATLIAPDDNASTMHTLFMGAVCDQEGGERAVLDAKRRKMRDLRLLKKSNIMACSCEDASWIEKDVFVS